MTLAAGFAACKRFHAEVCALRAILARRCCLALAEVKTEAHAFAACAGAGLGAHAVQTRGHLDVGSLRLALGRALAFDDGLGRGACKLES